MKNFFTLFLLCLSLSGFSQTPDSLNWYKMLAGNLDRYPVTMHLHKAGNHYLGFYYYNSRQQPIYFFGNDSAGGGTIRLSSYPAQEEEGEFSFSITASGANGQWKKSAASSLLTFMAVEMKPPVRCTYVFTNGSVKQEPNRKNSPEALYEAASVWPLGSSETDNYVKEVIKRAFKAAHDKNEEIGALFLKEKKAYFASYLKVSKGTQKGTKKPSPSHNMAVSDRMVFAYQSPRVVTLAGINYTYTGGAHGHYGTSFTVIDLVNRKTLSLGDILIKNAPEALVPLLEKNFRDSYHLTARDSLQAGGLYENTICLSENFFVTGKGIGFHYKPYEIGPYALGEITVFIPYKELEPILKPSFKSLLQ